MKKLISFTLLSLLFISGCSSSDNSRGLSSEEGSLIIFPSNAHKSKEVFVFGNDNTTMVMMELSDILDKINAKKSDEDKVKLRYFVELPMETGENDLMITSPQKHLRDLKLNGLEMSFHAKDLPESPKHAIFYLNEPDIYGWKPDLWMQDYGQFYTVDGVPTFLDLSYASLGNTSEIHRYIKSPKGLSGVINTSFKGRREASTQDKTLEGGDIEALPNGTILAGSQIHPDLENYFVEKLNQRVLKVPADFVATGHVDELFTIIPTPKSASNKCGYSLGFIDPLYGLRLAMDKGLVKAQLKDRQKYLDAVEYFTGMPGAEALSPTHFSKLSSRFKKEKPIAFEDAPWGLEPNYHQWYVYKALEVDIEIKKGIELIKKELSVSCPNLSTIGLPVLMSDEAAGESSLFSFSSEGLSPKEVSDEIKKASVHLLVSPVNQLVVDEHLIVPTINGLMGTSAFYGDFLDQYLKVFKWIVPARLKKVGVSPENIHFITTNVYIRNGGAVHCGTSSVRSSVRMVFE